MTTFASLSLLEISFLSFTLIELLFDCVNYALLLFWTLLAFSHDSVEISIVHIITSLIDTLLQLLNTLKVLALFLMLCLHLVVFDRFVELFAFRSMLLLLETLDFSLLLKNTALYACHVLV